MNIYESDSKDNKIQPIPRQFFVVKYPNESTPIITFISPDDVDHYPTELVIHPTESQKSQLISTVEEKKEIPVESSSFASKLVIGSKCQIYSQTELEWYKGKVTDIIYEDDKEWLIVM